MIQHTGQKIFTFRERFSELCNSNTMSSSALAEKLHVSRQTVSAWKIGTRSPKQPTIVAIAKHFNVSVEWLMGFDVAREARQTDEPRHLAIPDTEMFRKIIEEMTPSDYETVMTIFNATYNRMKEEGKA